MASTLILKQDCGKENAIKEFDIVVSLSARKRDINKKHISINDFFLILKKKNYRKLGLMFGPESSGLSNKELSFSNYILQIPTYKNFKSLPTSCKKWRRSKKVHSFFGTPCRYIDYSGRYVTN